MRTTPRQGGQREDRRAPRRWWVAWSVLGGLGLFACAEETTSPVGVVQSSGAGADGAGMAGKVGTTAGVGGAGSQAGASATAGGGGAATPGGSGHGGDSGSKGGAPISGSSGHAGSAGGAGEGGAGSSGALSGGSGGAEGGGMSSGGSEQWSGSGGQPGGASGATGGTGAAGVAGCGVAGQLSAEDFKALLIERVCEAYEPRCQEEQRPFDPAFCRSYLAQQHELLFGAGIYDAARAAQCLVSCPTSLEACGWVYLLNGTTPLGGACRGQTDCAPSPLGPVACIEPQLQISTYARTCQRVALGKGEDCKSELLSFFPPILTCAEGLHCDQQCTPKLLNGEKCSSGWFCASEFCYSGQCVEGDLEGDSCLGTTCSAVDLWCDEGVCVRRRPGGSPCAADRECQSRSCVSGLCWSEVGEACAAGALQPAEQFERERIHLECQHHAGCCDQNGSLFSQRWCELHRAYWPFQSQETYGKRMPLAQNFNPAAVDACLTQVAQSVECLTSISVLKLPPAEFISPPEDPDPCEAVYRAVPGALPGEPCTSRWDCAQPASGTVECYKGSCVQVIVGKPGEPCLPEGAILRFCRKKDGLWCSEEGVCQPLPAVGESCQWQVGCAAPAICTGEVCVEPKINGEPCSSQQVCPGGRCEQGACKPRRGNGEACEDASDCTSNHCVNQVCRLVTAPHYVCGPLKRTRAQKAPALSRRGWSPWLRRALHPGSVAPAFARETSTFAVVRKGIVSGSQVGVTSPPRSGARGHLPPGHPGGSRPWPALDLALHSTRSQHRASSALVAVMARSSQRNRVSRSSQVAGFVSSRRTNACPMFGSLRSARLTEWILAFQTPPYAKKHGGTSCSARHRASPSTSFRGFSSGRMPIPR